MLQQKATRASVSPDCRSFLLILHACMAHGRSFHTTPLAFSPKHTVGGSQTSVAMLQYLEQDCGQWQIEGRGQ